MYGGAGGGAGVGGALAVTGYSSLQIIGIALLGLSLCVAGLLVVRTGVMRRAQLA